MSSKLIDKDNGLKKQLEFFRQLRGLRGKVGIQGPKASEVEHSDSDLNNAEIGAVHEFGAPGIPQRSFLRATLDEKPWHWFDLLESELSRVVRDKANPKRALMIVVQKLRAAVIGRIDSGIMPPLSMVTLLRRNKGIDGMVKNAAAGTDDSTPLVDTGTLRGAITAVVEKTRG